MSSIKKFINNPAKIIHVLDRYGVSRIIPDKLYLRIKYKAHMGKRLNLENPKTYNEKLQWLKLYNRKPEYMTMVDKYEVKRYVAEIIGEEYIIPTLGIWNSVDEIEFDTLPEQFVLKCTHDSGGIVICKDKKQLDIQTSKEKLKKSMKRNFFYVGREWPYKNIKPRILAEAYMEDSSTNELRDYKFFCFDGVAKALFIATDRQTSGEEVKFDFFDMDFTHLDIRQGHPNANIVVNKPKTFEQMRTLAEKLSENIPQVRVDFYEVNGRTYFGELTFFHHDGLVPFDPEEWDIIFGDWITLPSKHNK